MQSGLLNRNSLKGAGPALPAEKERAYKGTVDLIHHWNNLGLHRCNDGTGNYRDAYDRLAKLRAGSLYKHDLIIADYLDKRFTNEEIMTVFETFSLAATNPNYLPYNKEKLIKMPLSNFLYNPFSKLEFARAHFLRWYTDEAVLIEKELYPEITQRLMSRYKYEVLSKTDYKLSEKDRMKFIRGANRVRQFLNERKIIQNLPFPVKPSTMADWLFDSLVRQNFDRIFPGHFCSDYTFNTALPAYLTSQGLMEKNQFKGRGI